MIVFFAWVIWIWMMIVILTDVFRRRDISGWSKALWVVFLIVLPFLGVLIYLITQHDSMTERNFATAKESRPTSTSTSGRWPAPAARPPRSTRPSSCSTAAPSRSRSSRR